jgi:hypothetical protein
LILARGLGLEWLDPRCALIGRVCRPHICRRIGSTIHVLVLMLEPLIARRREHRKWRLIVRQHEHKLGLDGPVDGHKVLGDPPTLRV